MTDPNNITYTDDVIVNVTPNLTINNDIQEVSGTIFTMMVVHSIIASVGMSGNLTVILVFLNHRKFRKKIPNIFIIHQVSIYFICSFCFIYSIKNFISSETQHILLVSMYYRAL